MRIITALFPCLLTEFRLCHIKNTRTFTSQLFTNNENRNNYKQSKLKFVRMMETTAKYSNTNVFKGHSDRFEGITVRSDKEDCSLDEFQQKLTDSLECWRQNRRRGVWFRVHLEQSGWVPILAKFGFKFHNAKDDFVTMYLWLPSDENCNIPHYANTLIGVGAVVVNEESQVLVVKEKYYNVPHWKLPGGYVEPGENIIDAAIREVWEETNISTEFQSILTLRHAHHGMFGCSDMYIVVNLKPLTNTIEKCAREIAESQWMDVEEYLNHPHVHELNRFFVQKYKEYNRRNIKIDCYHGVHQTLNKAYTVYYVTDKDEDKLTVNGGVFDEKENPQPEKPNSGLISKV